MADSEETAIYRFVEDWLEANDMNGSTLYRKAGLSTALYTQLKAGSTPAQKSIRALADAMGIGKGWLFLHSGYLDEDDLVVTDRDPEIERVVILFRKIGPANRHLMMTLLETAARD